MPATVTPRSLIWVLKMGEMKVGWCRQWDNGDCAIVKDF